MNKPIINVIHDVSSNFSYSNPTLRQNKEPKQDQTVKKKLSLFTTPKSFDHIHLKLLMTIYQKFRSKDNYDFPPLSLSVCM